MPLPSVPTLYKSSGETRPCPPANGSDYTLAEAQALVGGYVEVIKLPGTGWIIMLNEEGHIHRLPINDFATMEATMLRAIGDELPIVGDVVFCPDDMLR